MTNPQRFTPADVEQMVKALFDKGLHPSVVRRRLREQGVKWDYQFRGQSVRERVRRLKTRGQMLCPCGQGSFDRTSGTGLCAACLEKKWRG